MNTSLRFPVAALCVLVASVPVLSGCEKKAAPPAAAPPQQVQVVEVRPRPLHVRTQLPGRLEAYEIAMVRPQVNGVIQKRLFTEGADVVAGQQLYQIDPGLYQAALDSAKGQLAQARANAVTAKAKFDRYRSLVSEHAVSRQEYDDARAASDAAEAQILVARGQVESAEVNLRYTKVKSPITGRIGRSLLTVGALATAGQSSNMAVVTRLDPIFVDVNLPAVSLLRFRREVASGRIHTNPDNSVPVSLEMEDGSVYDLPGKMQFSEVNVDEATATVVVRAVFPNPKRMLLPGMYVHATLDEGTDPAAILVPQQAVSRNTHGDPQVLLVGEGNKVELRDITTGAASGADWVVSSGLKPGERVIVTGVQKVHPGSTVRPEPMPDDSASSEKK